MDHETVAQIDADSKFAGLQDERPEEPGTKPDPAQPLLHMEWQRQELAGKLFDEREQRREAAREREQQVAVAAAAALNAMGRPQRQLAAGAAARLRSGRATASQAAADTAARAPAKSLGKRKAPPAELHVPLGRRLADAPGGPHLKEGSAMKKAFPFMDEVLAGGNYIENIFGSANPKGPEFQVCSDGSTAVPSRSGTYVPHGQVVSLFVKGVSGVMSKVLMESKAVRELQRFSRSNRLQAALITMDMAVRAALTRHEDIMPLFQRAVVTDQEAFHIHELSQQRKFPTTCQEGEEGARWRWRMVFGEEPPKELPGMEVDANGDAHFTPLTAVERRRLLELMFDWDFTGAADPPEQQEQVGEEQL